MFSSAHERQPDMSAKDTKKKASAAEPSAASLRASPPLENPVLIGRGKEGLARVKALAAARSARKGRDGGGDRRQVRALTEAHLRDARATVRGAGHLGARSDAPGPRGLDSGGQHHAPPLLAGGLKRTNAQKTNKPQKARKSQTRR